MAPIIQRRPIHRLPTPYERHDGITKRTGTLNSFLLNRLPTELKLDILETAITNERGIISSLLVVCKSLAQLVEHIVYRTVTFSTVQAINLFHRTIQTKPAVFFDLVKEVVVTCVLGNIDTCSQLRDIVHTCYGLHKLTLPSTRSPMAFLNGILLASSLSPLQELTLETYRDDLMESRRGEATHLEA